MRELVHSLRHRRLLQSGVAQLGRLGYLRYHGRKADQDPSESAPIMDAQAFSGHPRNESDDPFCRYRCTGYECTIIYGPGCEREQW